MEVKKWLIIGLLFLIILSPIILAEEFYREVFQEISVDTGVSGYSENVNLRNELFAFFWKVVLFGLWLVISSHLLQNLTWKDIKNKKLSEKEVVLLIIWLIGLAILLGYFIYWELKLITRF